MVAGGGAAGGAADGVAAGGEWGGAGAAARAGARGSAACFRLALGASSAASWSRTSRPACRLKHKHKIKHPFVLP